ncbi:MAG: hypothetical protein AABY46_02865, partial [Nitrospirota bacterium]
MMRQIGHLRFIIATLIVIALLAIFPNPAQAIPAFSRTHQVPCSLCHVGFPKLNAFGIHFMMRGYRMHEEEGKYLWDQPIPLSGRINLFYQNTNMNWSPESRQGISGLPPPVDIKSSGLGIENWQLMAGGTLAPRISFMAQIVGLVERFGPDTTDELAPPTLSKPIEALHAGGLQLTSGTTVASDTFKTDIQTENLLVQFDDLLPDSRLNVRLGKYHVDNHFLSTSHRLTQAGYLIQIQSVLGPTIEPTSVGAELNGTVPIGLHYFVGVRNYGPEYDSKEDNERRLGAYYVLANQAVMGQTISFIVNTDRVGDANSNQDDHTLGYGAALDLQLGNLNVIPGLFGYREGPDIRSGDRLQIASGTVEAIYPIRPNLLGTLRYDFHRRNLQSDSL